MHFFRLNIEKIILLALMTLLAITQGCEQTLVLDRIQKKGELIVATKRSLTMHKKEEIQTGFEYELVKAFAKELNINIHFIYYNDLKTLLADVRHAKVHMAAASLTDTPERRKTVSFSLPYQYINEQLIYRRGAKKPNSLAEIVPNTLHVLAESSHAETLMATKKEYPKLEWVDWPEIEMNTLLRAVEEGHISYAIADSNDIKLGQQIYPHLLTAFKITSDRALAWAFPGSHDDSLRQAANKFLQEALQNGTIKRLWARYYGHTNQLNYVDKQFFRRHVRDRLPKYRDLFIEAAEKTGIDWRLLAAISYQESHWRANAVSPTGVRGLMMLTKTTAKQMGIKDRTNPRDSILGGAKYLKFVERKIPKRIQKTDRLWFTLASYNVGFGHLEDARILTQRQGASPDLWLEVKKRLPLLAKKEFHRTLRYGYARGYEPVIYVERIRNYYDLLNWYEHNPDALLHEDHADKL